MAESRILRKVLFALSVPKCLACRARLSEEDRALCHSCYEKYREIKTRNCARCSKLLGECSCTNEYLSRHFVKGLAKVYRYRATEDFMAANSIVYRLKKKNRKDALDFLAEEVAASIMASLPEFSSDAIVTHVPNRKSAIIQYGFDHAELLGRAVADKLGLEFMPLLTSLSKKPQKEMRGDARYANATFDLISEPDIKGREVIIVDDIVTTGASMGNSATILRSLRPKAIYGACVGIAYYDDFYKKENKK